MKHQPTSRTPPDTPAPSSSTPVPSRATTAEVEAAIQTLSDADLTRLEKFASVLISRSPRGRATYSTSFDLINTAIIKTLEGVRAWRRDLPLVVHLSGVMKSTIFHDANSKRVNPLVSETPQDVISAPATANPERMALAIEDDRDAAEIVSKICDHFKHDTDAANVLEGTRAGLAGPGIMEYFGMTRKQFDAAWKRIRRYARSDKGERR